MGSTRFTATLVPRGAAAAIVLDEEQVATVGEGAKRFPVRGTRPSAIAQLLVPVGRASLRRQVEQVPERLEGADVTWILAGIPRCVEELRAPEVADPVVVAVEHGQHRPLGPLLSLGKVVAV